MEAWYALLALVAAVVPLLLAWVLLARGDRHTSRAPREPASRDKPQS